MRIFSFASNFNFQFESWNINPCIAGVRMLVFINDKYEDKTSWFSLASFERLTKMDDFFHNQAPLC